MLDWVFQLRGSGKCKAASAECDENGCRTEEQQGKQAPPFWGEYPNSKP